MNILATSIVFSSWIEFPLRLRLITELFLLRPKSIALRDSKSSRQFSKFAWKRGFVDIYSNLVTLHNDAIHKRLKHLNINISYILLLLLKVLYRWGIRKRGKIRKHGKLGVKRKWWALAQPPYFQQGNLQKYKSLLNRIE